ncbi:Ger(x)C family spore germination protein [Paenibacillus wynnii]|uniref:Ger(x)C family spore germination protein n=1 Tax=Paenibacillus wynnii TaxID=268407 RepID=UPI00069260A5|nr:Ger(x)C family spore germination protein [Paenibacillus wynnii]
MKRLSFSCIVILLTLVLTGCWDRTEINDIAIVMAASFDLLEDGKMLCTYQIANPSTQTGSSEAKGPGQKFVIVSAVGEDVQELLAKAQKQLSRKIFRAHRRIIIIGERMAEHGIGEILDSISRDPSSRIRTFILIVKGGEGQDIIKMGYPFESTPAEGMREMMVNVGEVPKILIRDLITASSSEGIEPIVGTIKSLSNKSENEPGFQISGAAILKDLKLSGYLNNEETSGLQWIKGDISNWDIKIKVPGTTGNVSITLTNMRRRIKPIMYGDVIKINLELEGKGVIKENDPNLDLFQPKNINTVQAALQNQVNEQIRQIISKAQKKYKADIFGFGDVIHRKYPRQWKSLEKDWDNKFSMVEAAVTSDLTITDPGIIGAPLYLKKSEINK